jgi:2-polyprenyl-3-methyl-5-hydroxy-6-metoxy-1,4-benzoquinol methylase
LLLRILPLRHVPGLKAFYQWLLDDRSQPVPVPMAVANRNSKPVTGAITNAPATRPQALELGCANGSYLARLEAAGWTTVGIEPAVKPARAAKEAGLNVICGLLESVELPPESFDLTAAWMVIEHVPDPAVTLRNLFQLLKPGGHLLFSIPNAG